MNRDSHSFDFNAGDYSIKTLSEGDSENIQKLFDKSKDYFSLVFDRNPSPTESQELFNEFPEGKSKSDKVILGVSKHENLIGIIDLVKNYPSENIYFIGLFLLAPEERGKGLGETIINSLFGNLKTVNVAEVRISVAENNTKALNFWNKLGFNELNRKNKEGKTFIYLNYLIK